MSRYLLRNLCLSASYRGYSFPSSLLSADVVFIGGFTFLIPFSNQLPALAKREPAHAGLLAASAELLIPLVENRLAHVEMKLTLVERKLAHIELPDL